MASIKVESPSVVYDKLIGGTAIATITKNISISAGNALERGAVLDENGALVANGATAMYVVAVPASATDTVATVYTAGQFNREKLSVASDTSVDAHEAELRAVGIYLTSLHK